MCCITYRDTLFRMSSAISVRLDAEALRALAQLEATGLSRSEAIRRAILESAARLQRRAALAAEVAALEADEDDRREMLEVAALMEIMRAAG
jgi:Arc/MetJ-type ribon-helix-helix transcriptional regulator